MKSQYLIAIFALFFTFTANKCISKTSWNPSSTPTITALSANICAGGSITITGTNFTGITAANVTIGGVAVSSITSSTSTQIIAVVNTACSGIVKVTTSGGTATSTGTFTCYAIPAPPTVTTPVNYCLNAVASQLTATGSNLIWGGGTISGTAGGTNVLTTNTYLGYPGSNKETDFTTTAANVEITTVDYYIPAWQSVSGLQLALYNSSGTAIATSSTITTLTNGSTAVTISNTFNYTIALAGNYSIGVAAGSGTGTVGGDSPTFPITEPTGTINVTGTNSLGTAPYHCFNNIQFTVNGSSATAPTPSTSTTGTTDYLVSQTVSGCVSPEATIAVIVNAPPSATISYSGTPFCKSLSTPQSVTFSGTGGGTYSALPTGLSINASTGAITPSSSTAGTYTVTYTMAASGGCSAQTATASVTITAIPSATISYSGTPFCKSLSTPQSVTFSGTVGGTYSALPSGLNINSSSGAITPSSSTAGTYTVTYTMAASGGCSAQTATASVTITAIPSATISYSGTPFCKSLSTPQSVTFSGTVGGTYSALPSGLNINSSSGAITPSSSTAGTYTVTYTMAAFGGCSAQTATTSVTITAIPSASISYSGTPFCKSLSTPQSVTFSGTVGGTYSASPSGLSIDASTGAITPSTSTPGNFTVTYTMSASGGCSAQTATTSVTITAIPSASISYSGTPFCKSLSTPQSVTFSGTVGGTYSASPSGLSIDASTGAITPFTSTPGNFTVTYTMAASGGCSIQTTTTSVTINATPAAPTVTTPVKYCLNAVASQLTATGSNLTWSGGTISGTAGGSAVFTTSTYLSSSGSKTDFTTTAANVEITTVDYYIPAYQAVTGLQLALYNSSGTVIATSSNITTLNNSVSTTAIISNTFNYIIAVAGNYSIGVYAGYGIVGYDNPSFPITEPTGTINITGVSVSGYRFFNNIEFTVDNGSTAPTPSTSVSDTTNYMVSQTVNGCVSPQATIAVIVNPLSVGGTVNSNATVCTGTNSGTVYLSGQTGSVVKWQYSIDGGTSWSDITNVTDSETYSNLAQTTIGRAVVQSGVCASANSSPDTITVVAPGSWSGSVSTDWNDSRNWLCGQIPTSAINVTIPGGASYYPVVSSGIDTAKNITIASGGSLTVGSGTLQIFGSIANSGTLDATNGTLEMKGAGAQTLDGSAFYKRTINNLIVSNTGSGLSVSSTANDTLKITGTLTFGNSGSTLNTGDNITLVSNSAGTASLGIVGSGNTITGQVVVERYINIGTVAGQHAKSWQFLATPTVGQTVKQSWMENGITTSTGYGTMVTGAGGTAAGFDVYTASPSLKYFVPSTDSWTGIANTNIPIYNPNGYLVFVRGDRSVTAYNQPPNNTILRTKGTLLTGTQSPLSVTPNEYGSIGNPYPSPVDFTLITKGNGIDDLFYVWDPYLYGSYGYGGYQTLSSANEWKPVPGGTLAYPTGTPYYILQSGQAIFVHATSILPYNASDYNLTFSEDDKSSSSSTNVSRVNGLAPTVNHESLNVSLYTGNTIADGNTVVFDRSYSDNVDGNDALKILNQGENFGLLRNGKLLAIEARAPASVSDTLYYDMSNLSITSYQLRFAPENMSSTGLQAYLIDNFLNTATPVSLTDSSSVNISITSNPASYAYNRFDVVFRTLSAMPVTFTSITAVQKNADIEVDWKVENESGIQQYEVEESADGSQFTQVATVAVNTNGSGNYSWLDENATPGYHYYRVRSVGKDGQIQYTDIVKVLIGNSDASISVYPNPVVNDDIHLQFNNQPAGVYGIRLLNTLGQLIVSKVINHSDGSSSEDLSPDHKLPKGIYQVEVTKPDGTVEVVKVVN